MTSLSLVNKLADVARRARRGDYADAASALNRALQEMQGALHRVKPADLPKLTYSLQTMLMMQTQGDWVALADVIEYEFIALLRAALSTTDAT